MKAIDLKVEYLKEPMTLGTRVPRFYWKCYDGIKQTAYQLQVSVDGRIIWDSEKVESADMTHIEYAGEPLQSRMHVQWQIRLWDENNACGEWMFSWFELGLFEQSDWKARWITGNYASKKNKRYPVDYFRKIFHVKPVLKRARLYISALGLYEAHLNGNRVGEFRLAPGCTDYRKKVQYQAYDITEFLSEKNYLDIKLADGWFRGTLGAFGLDHVYGRQAELLWQLELFYENGEQEILYSDESMNWCQDGPIQFADLQDGEIIDARVEPSYSSRAKIGKSTLFPVASDNVPVVEKEKFKAKMIKQNGAKTLLDFGQNIAGFVTFKVNGNEGQSIKIRCGEILDSDGNLTLKNIQAQRPNKDFGKLKEVMLITGKSEKISGELVLTPKQEIKYICNGKKDVYKTEFAIFGFRYIEVDTEVSINEEDFEAIAVYSDMDETGKFSCSNEDVNQLFSNILWSMKGNFLDLPTDCPTRERIGWTGDGQIFFNTAAYLMDITAFYRKWLRDIEIAQESNGSISASVPYVGLDILYKNMGNSVGWADAIILIPYRFWKRYGDVRLLNESYPMMKKYAEFMIKKCGPKKQTKKLLKNKNDYKYVYEKGFHLGEWLEPEDINSEVVERTSKLEESLAYFSYSMSLLTEMASNLGYYDDSKKYKEYADGSKRVFNELFVINDSIISERQAKQVRPLAMDLLDLEAKNNVEKRLVDLIMDRDYRIGTGFLSTVFVLPTLTKAGYTDIAYKMLENDVAPSWLYEVKEGATTIWEDWEGHESQNHYSPGAVGEWMFETVCGINIGEEERTFILKPIPGGSITSAEAIYNSLYGSVASKWEKTDDGTRYCFEIPPNTCAEIILQDGSQYKVETGNYEYHLGDVK